MMNKDKDEEAEISIVLRDGSKRREKLESIRHWAMFFSSKQSGKRVNWFNRKNSTNFIIRQRDF